jgi:hypothetical protein
MTESPQRYGLPEGDTPGRFAQTGSENSFWKGCNSTALRGGENTQRLIRANQQKQKRTRAEEDEMQEPAWKTNHELSRGHSRLQTAHSIARVRKQRASRVSQSPMFIRLSDVFCRFPSVTSFSSLLLQNKSWGQLAQFLAFSVPFAISLEVSWKSGRGRRCIDEQLRARPLIGSSYELCVFSLSQCCAPRNTMAHDIGAV